MGKLNESRMSHSVMDGLLRKIPGFESGLYGDQLPFFINSPVMTLHTAVTNQGSFVAPCDMTIVGCIENLVELPGTANATVLIGTRADPNAFATAITSLTSGNGGVVGATVLDVATDFDGVSTVNVSQGDVIEFATGGEATTTGLAAYTLVCVPRQ